jgi:TatA/E family protein of Tat protein translocase
MGLPNIGPLELIIILAIALLIVGPGRLPEMGNAIGRTIKEFRKASTDITDVASMEPDKAAAPEPATAVPAAATAATVSDAPAAAVAPEVANVAAVPAEPASQTEANALSGAAIPNTTTLSPPAAAPPEPKADGKADA